MIYFFTLFWQKFCIMYVDKRYSDQINIISMMNWAYRICGHNQRRVCSPQVFDITHIFLFHLTHSPLTDNRGEKLMASITGFVGAGLFSSGAFAPTRKPGDDKLRRTVKVRAESINPEIRKSEDKVVDSVDLTQLSKPITPYCRYYPFFYSLPFFTLCLILFYL